MDYTAIILWVVQGLIVLFMLWIRSDSAKNRADMKLEIKEEQDRKTESIRSECICKMDDLRDRMESRMIDAVKDQFVRLDVYKSDQEKTFQQFVMLQKVVDLQLENINTKLDSISSRLGKVV